MAWRSYGVIFSAMSPVHIGHYMLGYINRTRYYIPGRAMWGAITANLTRAFFSYIDYREVGVGVKDHVLTSYFYPAIEQEKPLLPHFSDEGLKFADLSSADFERRFIKAFGQTAIHPSSNTAEEGSLHEVEYISHNVDCLPVKFVGYLLMNEGALVCGKKLGWNTGEVKLEETIQNIFIGGERKYGFGRLRLETSLSPDAPDWFGNTLKIIEGSRPLLEIDENRPIPAHLEIDESYSLKGDIEALVGRGWVTEGAQLGPGRAPSAISNGRLCWVPGSIAGCKMELEIGDFGILKSGE